MKITEKKDNTFTWDISQDIPNDPTFHRPEFKAAAIAIAGTKLSLFEREILAAAALSPAMAWQLLELYEHQEWRTEALAEERRCQAIARDCRSQGLPTPMEEALARISGHQ